MNDNEQISKLDAIRAVIENSKFSNVLTANERDAILQIINAPLAVEDPDAKCTYRGCDDVRESIWHTPGTANNVYDHKFRS
jgi:hypothetical protein